MRKGSKIKGDRYADAVAEIVGILEKQSEAQALWNSRSINRIEMQVVGGKAFIHFRGRIPFFERDLTEPSIAELFREVPKLSRFDPRPAWLGLPSAYELALATVFRVGGHHIDVVRASKRGDSSISAVDAEMAARRANVAIKNLANITRRRPGEAERRGDRFGSRAAILLGASLASIQTS